MEYILKKDWKSSNFYVFPKVYKSKKIIGQINKTNDICINMEPPKHLEEKTITGVPNSPTQGISGVF